MIRSLLARSALIGLALASAPPSAHADEAELVGSWDAKFTVNFSTCDTAKVGDIAAAQLVLRLEDGWLLAETLGNRNVRDGYAGHLDARGLSLYAWAGQKAPARGWWRSKAKGKKTHEATIEATVNGAVLTGRRIVANEGPCVILYDFTAKKL